MASTPAKSLEGLELEGGWKVLKKIDRHPTSTGGHFSVGYIVKDEDNKEGYLKALDFSRALQTDDPARELQSMTTAYNFERDLLAKCKEHKLRRVVTPLADGTVTVPGNFGDLSNVCYLIFEKAEGDIRKQCTKLQSIDLAWCLRSLHHTATGIRQLHSRGIAHQDLKPSNVLVYKNVGSKVTDLGRASYISLTSPVDGYKIPGDVGYAPPELFYGYEVSDEFERRFAVDIYLLGSLFFFYFANVSATQAIKTKLKSHASPNLSNANFINDLPYIRKAFYEAVKDLEENIVKKAGSLTGDISIIVKQLCEPDPRLRGHPRNRTLQVCRQYCLERYVTRLDLLAKRAEYGLL
jgi:serine/threonine protein kinase